MPSSLSFSALKIITWISSSSKVPTTIFYNGNYLEVNILAIIMVYRRLFWGELPLTQTRGFVDESNGHLIAREVTTSWLNVAEVEKDWRQIESADEVAVKPKFEFVALDLFDITETP